MIKVSEVHLEIDEAARRFGLSQLPLAVSISDTTAFHERTWEPIERYCFRATV